MRAALIFLIFTIASVLGQDEELDPGTKDCIDTGLPALLRSLKYQKECEPLFQSGSDGAEKFKECMEKHFNEDPEAHFDIEKCILPSLSERQQELAWEYYINAAEKNNSQ